MKVRVSLLMIVLLLMQMVLPGVAPLQTASSEKDNVQNELFDFDSISEADYVEDEGNLFVNVDWSLEDYQLLEEEVEKSIDFESPLKLVDQETHLTIQEDQELDLAVVVVVEGELTVTFNEVAPEYSKEQGTVKLQVEIEEQEEIVEDDAVNNQPVEEDSKEIKSTNVVAQIDDLDNIFKFEYFKLNGEDIKDGAEIIFGIEYQLQYKWDTKEFDTKAGDTARLQLPDVFKQWPENTPALPILTSGDPGKVVGKYTISGDELVFIFDEGIENASVHNGYVGFNFTFDNEKFIEVWEQEIDFDGDGVKDLTVVAKPNEVQNNLEKEGQADQFKNAREITWSVDITNGNEEAITNGVLKDILPDGVGEPIDFVVEEFTYNFEGNKVPGEPVSFNDPIINGNEFELTFDNVPARGGYTVEYTTTITDKAMTKFTNNVTFTAEDVNLDANTTVTIGERSNPIKKSGGYDWSSGQINWTIVVNENGEKIDHAIVHDVLPPELTIVEESIKVTKNWQATDIEVTDFPITLGPISADEVYIITFSTAIDWSQVNEGEYQPYNEFTNWTELTDGEDLIGEDDALVGWWSKPILTKSGNKDDYTYDDKILTWEIVVNEAKHPISNAVVTDILPAGLGTITPKDITIEGAQVDTEAITITSNSDGTQTVVINLGNIDDEVTISYKTEVEKFDVDEFKNEASLGGEGIGEDTPKDGATVNPPENSYKKYFKSIDYNAKTIDWSIEVDPIREPITALEITDTFPTKGLILLPESVVVKMGDTVLGSGDYTLVPNTEGEETGYNKGFTITLDNISEDTPLNQVITIDFTTSYDPQLEVYGNTIDDHEGNPTQYVNHADFTGKTMNGHDIKEEYDDAERYVRQDSWNSGKKEGQLVHFDEEGNKVEGWESGSERKIAWQLYTNYQEQNLGTGVVITDTLDYEGTIDKDSIVVSVYEIDKEGNTTITNTTLADDKYEVVVDDNTFTLRFAKGFVVDERYVIEFTTSVPDISQKKYKNDATVKVGETEYEYDATVEYDKWEDHLDKQLLGQEGTEVFIGEELEWEVTVNEGLSVIKGAKITDTISAGLVYVEDSLEITTGSDVELEEDVDYEVNVTTTDAGETVLSISFKNDLTEALTLNYTTVVIAKDGDQVGNNVELESTSLTNTSTGIGDQTAKQFSWVGGEYNPRRGTIKVQKVDSDGNVIETGEARFELYFEMNDERILVGEYPTKNGILEIPNLPLRTYYLMEVAAPDGYVLADKEFEIVVDKAYGSEQIAFEVPITNYKEGEEPQVVEVAVEKVWNDANNQDGIRPDLITVNLLANDEVVDSTDLNADNEWSATFIDLPAVDEDGNEIAYTVEEVTVEGYAVNITGTAADGFIITNTHEPEVIDVAGTKTWNDADDQDGKRPKSITVNLLANGTEVDSVEVTSETDWTFEFTGLPKFENGVEITYTIQEDGVEDYSTEIDGFDITNSYTPEQTSVNVVKAWDDANNQDGIRPESITVKLLANGEETGQEVILSEDNNWQADFTELDVNANSEAIEYTVEEVTVEGYAVNITGTAADGFIITNTHEPEVIDVAGTKTWNDADDQDGKRPKSITVNLLANGTEVDSVEVTSETDWTFEFTDIPKFENGVEITYTVQEDFVADYSATIDGFDITNSYTPGKTSINVVKVWDDRSDQAGIRPDQITVILFANGEKTDHELILTADGNWQGDFIDLDTHQNGVAIEYTIEEISVVGYETEIKGTSENGFVITNSHDPDEPETPTEEPEDPTEGIEDPEDGHNLPRTATNLFNFLVIGLGLLISGLVLIKISGGKRRLEN